VKGRGSFPRPFSILALAWASPQAGERATHAHKCRLAMVRPLGGSASECFAAQSIERAKQAKKGRGYWKNRAPDRASLPLAAVRGEIEPAGSIHQTGGLMGARQKGTPPRKRGPKPDTVVPPGKWYEKAGKPLKPTHKGNWPEPPSKKGRGGR